MIKVSVVIPVLNEAGNIGLLINKINYLLDNLNIEFEIIVVDGGSRDKTVEIAKNHGAKVIKQRARGFGNALREGFRVAQGEVLLTLDADFSHPPDFIPKMLQEMNRAEIVIASRYLEGGSADVSCIRYFLGRSLNLIFQYGLSLPIKDITSGFRAYNREVIDLVKSQALDFDVQPEIIIEAFAKGWRIKEVPFSYGRRRSGSSHMKIFAFALGYLKVFIKLWKRRNSIDFCDYDERAYFSRIFIQRYWQRKRYSIIMEFVEKRGFIADLGCGSSKIIQDLPEAIAVDLFIEKLRYIRKTNKRLVNADIKKLPFKNETIDCIICSQTIEHVEETKLIFEELNRVMQPRGILVLGTPDYSRFRWRFIEFFYGLLHPGGYKDLHITKYTSLILKDTLESYNFRILAKKYICGSELIIKAEKIGRKNGVA